MDQHPNVDALAVRIASLFMLPWTLVPSRNEAEGYLVLRVRELPDVIATGANEEDLERDLFESLRASFETRMHYGDPIPLPPGVKRLPWERPKNAFGLLRGHHIDQSPNSSTGILGADTGQMALA